MAVRRWSAVGFVAVALVVGLASVAWACTEQAYLDAVDADGAVPAGSTVQVPGYRFAAGADQPPVSIRWAEPNGPQLATTDGPSFSVPVRIPDSASPGVYRIYAVQTVDGTTYVRRTSVKVAGAEEATSAPSPSPADTSPATPGTEQTPTPAAGEAPASAVASAPTATASPASPATRRIAPRAAVGSSQAPTGGQATAVAADPAVGQEPEAAPVADAAPLPSRESVSADLWGGLASGDTRQAGPSLADGARASDQGAPVSAGTATLLGMGLVLVATATAVGMGRRQRARAGSPNRPAE